MRQYRNLIFLWLFISSISASAQEFIPIWPSGKKPNSNGKAIKDSLFNERIWRVETPGIYAFPVPHSNNTGTAVLICPGGGYERLSHIYNGFEVAKWFNVQGINAFVLIYRLPHQTDLLQRQLAPLQDAQRAIRMIRANADKWGIKTDKLGVMGTSAGGHVASTLGTYAEDVSSVNDTLDRLSFRPDFMLLLSPVVTMGEYAHQGSKKHFLGTDTSSVMIKKYSGELQVSSYTPPTFIVHAYNDKTVNVRNSLQFYAALNEKNINASLHVFPQGAHGIKMSDNPGSTDYWTALLAAWLKETGMLSPLGSK